MKIAKIVLIISVILMCIIGGIISYMHFSFPKTKDGILVINDVERRDVKISFCQNEKKQYIMIPLLTVLQEIGCDIERETSEQVYITINSITYILDLKKETLYEESNDVNLLIPAPGIKNFVCSFTETDVIVDNVTFKSLCSYMEIPINIDIDFKNQIYTITLE